MIRLKSPEECCGCSACARICAHGAITMEPDALGFNYPRVDANLCTNCGLCEKVCAFGSGYATDGNLTQPLVYAVRHKDRQTMATSRSGGAFIAFSDRMLEQGGTVYGAAFEDRFRVVHKRAASKAERDAFKGSKYVQSDMGTAFASVLADLRAGGPVLFSGTPCQTAGLRSFLAMKRADTRRLYLCDIVCHGVPAPYVWRDYLAYQEKRHGRRITGVNFRDKHELGWAAHQESFTFEGGKGVVYSDIFTRAFYAHILFRPACGVCPYTNFRRPSDITLGDYWGWQRVDPQFGADDKGVSLVLVNTRQGERLFDAVSQRLDYLKSSPELAGQPNLRHPSEIHPDSALFEQDFAGRGFEYAMKRRGLLGWKYDVRRLAGRYVGKVKNGLRRLLKATGIR